MRRSCGLLVVDDHETNREGLARRLRKYGYDVSVAASGPESLAAISDCTFQLVLLDIDMPGMSGLAVLEVIRQQYAAAELPVIMVSAKHESESVASALQLGANDYVTRPIDFPLVLSRIETQLERRHVEVTRRRSDILTGLPNRLALDEWWRDHGEATIGVLLVNIDRFRAINNGLGWSHGDEVLKEVARRLGLEAPFRSIVARTKGDEFVCLFTGSRDEAVTAVTQMLGSIREPFIVDNQRVLTAASAGITVADGARRIDEALTEADTALYRAKTLGGNRYEVFDSRLRSRALTRLQTETELRQAIAEDAFALRYQPIYNLADDTIAGFEVLVRWNHPQKGELAPAEFIPVAEETGLICDLGALVLRGACEQLIDWQRCRVGLPPITLNVNVSSMQLADPSFIDTVRRVISETGINPRLINLEITESVLMEKTDQTRHVLRWLGALGVGIALDDFGTGYSSLSYLQNFPLSSLKLDKSFVKGFPECQMKSQIVRAILSLGRSFGMRVVAEGIESAIELEELRALGCDFGQGFYLSRPVDAESAIRMVTQTAMAS